MLVHSNSKTKKVAKISSVHMQNGRIEYINIREKKEKSEMYGFYFIHLCLKSLHHFAYCSYHNYIEEDKQVLF